MNASFFLLRQHRNSADGDIIFGLSKDETLVRKVRSWKMKVFNRKEHACTSMMTKEKHLVIKYLHELYKK